eukprot:6078185-Pleurochrysis_carterae.AAC.3
MSSSTVTGMRIVPDLAEDQQIRRDRDPLLAKNDEVLPPVPRYAGGVQYADRAYFSWEPAAAFVRKLGNTIADQQRAGTKRPRALRVYFPS